VNPAFISSGGIIVPNKARTTPHFRKISKLNGVTCVTIEENKLCCPRSIYKLRCALEILLATRLAVNIVVVKTLLPSYP
jgi:hypothetical protein